MLSSAYILMKILDCGVYYLDMRETILNYQKIQLLGSDSVSIPLI